MDTLTHALIGAGAGEVLLGKKNDKGKAAFAGAFFANLPDLDVLFGTFINDLQQLTFHRGPTHSLLFALIASIVLGLVLKKYTSFGKHSSSQKIYLFTFFCLFSHIILDLFTSYGMLLFWPFSYNPVSLNIISIIDPLFTLPLLLGLLIYYIFKTGKKTLYFAFLISFCYLFFTFYNKYQVQNYFIKHTENAPEDAELLNTKPTLLNNILWRGIAENEAFYFVSFYSFFDSKKQEWTAYPKNQNLIDEIRHHREITILLRALEHQYIIEKTDSHTWYVHDMRFGRAVEWLPDRVSNFVFSYKVELIDNEIHINRDRKDFSDDADRPDFNELIQRILGNF